MPSTPTEPRNDAQASPQASKRNATTWRPGQSGNPLGGAILKRRTEAQLKRRDELRTAIASEFPGELNALEDVLIHQTAEALELSERSSDNNKVRLVRLALQLMQRIRQGRTEKAAAKPVLSAFDLYVAEKAAER